VRFRVVVGEGEYSYAECVPHKIRAFNPLFSGIVVEHYEGPVICVSRFPCNVFINREMIKDKEELFFTVFIGYFITTVAGVIGDHIVCMCINTDYIHVIGPDKSNPGEIRDTTSIRQLDSGSIPDPPVVDDTEYLLPVVMTRSDMSALWRKINGSEFDILHIYVVEDRKRHSRQLIVELRSDYIHSEYRMDMRLNAAKDRYLTSSSLARSTGDLLGDLLSGGNGSSSAAKTDTQDIEVIVDVQVTIDSLKLALDTSAEKYLLYLQTDFEVLVQVIKPKTTVISTTHSLCLVAADGDEMTSKKNVFLTMTNL
jgi:hypothetical protein